MIFSRISFKLVLIVGISLLGMIALATLILAYPLALVYVASGQFLRTLITFLIMCCVLAWRSAIICARRVESAIGASAIMPRRLMPTIRTSLKLMREKIIEAHMMGQ